MPEPWELAVVAKPKRLSADDVASVPAVIRQAGDRAAWRFLEFFTANIRNKNTRAAYARAVRLFCDWLDEHGVQDLARVNPVLVAAYVEQLGERFSKPSVKQHLAAIRMLMDYLVTGGVLPFNPASSVRGPKHVVKRGKTPVLTAEEARALLDSIPLTQRGRLARRRRPPRPRAHRAHGLQLRPRRRRRRDEDRGLLRPGEALVVPAPRERRQAPRRAGPPQRRGLHGRLPRGRRAQRREEGSPLPHDPRPQRRAHRRSRLTRNDALRMIKRRAKAAGLSSAVCCHTFRATGITAYLENGGTIENAQAIAAHESPRTTKLYDRTSDEITLDEVERIAI